MIEFWVVTTKNLDGTFSEVPLPAAGIDYDRVKASFSQDNVINIKNSKYWEVTIRQFGRVDKLICPDSGGQQATKSALENIFGQGKVAVQ